MTMSTRPLLFRSASVAFASGVVALMACSSSAPGGAGTAGAFVLSGTYTAVDSGPIAEITFYAGNQYLLLSSACAEDAGADPSPAPPDDAGVDGGGIDEAAAFVDGGFGDGGRSTSCSEMGTFTVNAAADALLLTPALGMPYSLPFQNLATTELTTVTESEALTPDTSDEGLHVLGGLTGPTQGLTSDAGSQLIACTGVGLENQASQGVPVGSAQPTSSSIGVGGQTLKGGAAAGSSPDPSKGWSCGGSFNKQPPSPAYYITSFGCANGFPFDSGDNCCAAGARQAYDAGFCPMTKAKYDTEPAANCPNTCQTGNRCNSWRSTQTNKSYAANYSCEAEVKYYATGVAQYGAGTRICVQTADGKKGVVADVYDNGPSCAIERKVHAHVLDVSPAVAKYLYGSSEFSAPEKKKVLVTLAGPSAKVGQSCAAGCGVSKF
jgi:hypothetical protein